jgi:hypothetical protein
MRVNFLVGPMVYLFLDYSSRGATSAPEAMISGGNTPISIDTLGRSGMFYTHYLELRQIWQNLTFQSKMSCVGVAV